METLLRDLKHAFRMLRRSPGFIITAVSALALGIGANAAIFSVVNAVLLSPLPFAQPERIVQLMNSTPQGEYPAASVPKFNVWQTQRQVFQEVAAYDSGELGINITGGDRPQQVRGVHVSHEFFRLFGAQVALGRTFSAGEDRTRGGRVVVLSHGLWQSRFGSDPSTCGKGILLGGEPYTVIGVIGSTFSFDPAPDLYLPFQADPDSTQQAHYVMVAARL